MSDTAPTLKLDDPRVAQLDRVASRAYLEIVDAMEEAARAGVPAEVIARYANVPLSEVELMLQEMRASAREASGEM